MQKQCEASCIGIRDRKSINAIDKRLRGKTGIPATAHAGLWVRLVRLCTLGQEADGEHFEEEEFLAPSTGPPGFCGALVGPIAIFVAVTAVCDCPTGTSLAIAKLESATAIAVAKIKYFI